MQLFDIAARHRSWLAQSQSQVAANVANADTPGYTARHTQDFAEILKASTAKPEVTHPAHIAVAAEPTREPDEGSEAEFATHSGNTVDLDAEMLRAGELRGGYALNTSVTKAFHRMLQASVRS